MIANARAYFLQTLVGESRYWSWLIGFWFIFIGWIVAQSVITSPFSAIAEEIDPELGVTFQNLALELFSGEDALKLIGLMVAFFLGALLTVICWIINRATKNTARTIFGVLTGIFGLISFVAMIASFPMQNSPEMASILNQILAGSPLAYALMLLTFPGTLVGVYLVQKFIHKRTLVSLHTAAKKFRWFRAFQAVLIMWAVMGIGMAILHFTGLSPLKKLEFNAGRFVTYGLISLLFIPLQSATEEIIVRGYMNQGFAHFIKSKWVVFIITSLFFMALHLANPEALKGAEEGVLILTMSSYFLFGFILCIVVDFDNGLESACGVHAANNLFAAIAVNAEGSVLPTPSLFHAQINPHVDVPSTLILLSVVAWLLYKTRKPLTESDLGTPGKATEAPVAAAFT